MIDLYSTFNNIAEDYWFKVRPQEINIYKEKKNNIQNYNELKIKKILENKCVCCGRDIVDDFHNSHTIPNGVLKNINVNGKVFNFKELLEYNIFNDSDTGIGTKGLENIFKLICKDCDNQFGKYEDFKKRNFKITKDILAQISIKNYLKCIYENMMCILNSEESMIFHIKNHLEEIDNEVKRCGEILNDLADENINQQILKRIFNKSLLRIRLQNVLNIIIEKKDLDIKYDEKLYEYDEGLYLSYLKNEIKHLNIMKDELKIYKDRLNKSKKILEEDNLESYTVIYHQVLDYVVPIAFQNRISVFVDLKDKLIKFGDDFEDIHICVFPLKYTTEIIVFMDNNTRSYSSFIKQFNLLDNEDKLSLLNYILFLYSDNIYFSKNIDKEVIENLKLQHIMTNGMFIISNKDISDEDIKKKIYTLSKRHNINNLLSYKFKLK